MPSPDPRWHLPRRTPRRARAGDEPGSLSKLLPGNSLKIALVHGRALLLREVELVQDAQRLADIHRAAFGIERAVAREHDLLHLVKRHAAQGRGFRRERRSVGVEILFEVVEWALFQRLHQALV